MPAPDGPAGKPAAAGLAAPQCRIEGGSDGKQAELDGKQAELDGKQAELDGKQAELDGKQAERDGKIAQLICSKRE